MLPDTKYPDIGAVFSYNSLGKAVESNENTVKKYLNIFANAGGECDFVIKNGFEYQAVQVCYELTPENSKREFGGFPAIEKETKLSRKTIITYNQEQQSDDIEVVPAWKFFLKRKNKQKPIGVE